MRLYGLAMTGLCAHKITWNSSNDGILAIDLDGNGTIDNGSEIFTPGFGGGYYNAASGLDLGFDAEFRSSLELSRRFRNGSRLGFVFAHVSNGSLGDKNPGSETLGLNCAVPLDRLFRRRAVPAAAD